MASRWVTIRVCEYGEAQVLQGELEANGIPVDLPGESVMRSDMFMRGGNAFMLEVRVPDTAVEQARQLLAPFDEGERHEYTGESELEPEVEDVYARRASTETARVGWAGASMWLAPWALEKGLREGVDPNASPAQRRDHRTAIVVAALFTALALLYVASQVTGVLD